MLMFYLHKKILQGKVNLYFPLRGYPSKIPSILQLSKGPNLSTALSNSDDTDIKGFVQGYKPAFEQSRKI